MTDPFLDEKINASLPKLPLRLQVQIGETRDRVEREPTECALRITLPGGGEDLLASECYGEIWKPGRKVQLGCLHDLSRSHMVAEWVCPGHEEDSHVPY